MLNWPRSLVELLTDGAKKVGFQQDGVTTLKSTIVKPRSERLPGDMMMVMMVLTKEAEAVEMQRRVGSGVEQERVPRGAGVAAAVGRGHQQRQRPVLQLLAHLGDALAVAAAAVVHAFAWQDSGQNRAGQQNRVLTYINLPNPTFFLADVVT